MMDIFPVNLVQAEVDPSKIGKLFDPIISNIVYPLIGLMFAVAVVVFAYGVLQLVFKGDDTAARDQAKASILYGVLGMFIMVSAWGIIYFISNTVKAI